MNTHQPPGERRLRQAIARRREGARRNAPRPYDDDWGWWVEERLARLQKGQRWLIRIAAAALAAEVIRIATTALGLGG